MANGGKQLEMRDQRTTNPQDVKMTDITKEIITKNPLKTDTTGMNLEQDDVRETEKMIPEGGEMGKEAIEIKVIKNMIQDQEETRGKNMALKEIIRGHQGILHETQGQRESQARQENHQGPQGRVRNQERRTKIIKPSMSIN